MSRKTVHSKSNDATELQETINSLTGIIRNKSAILDETVKYLLDGKNRSKDMGHIQSDVSRQIADIRFLVGKLKMYYAEYCKEDGR